MPAGADIVGDVEQRRDEHLVGRDAFGLDGFARAADRQIFRDEAALGADRHDDGVLDVLRLDQAQDFGAEILRPVGPADAAARHLAEAQMHGLDARRIDENLVERPRQRHAVDLAARKLDGDQVLGLAVAAELIEIGADRCLHRIDEVAQDAVLVQAFDRLQGGFDRRCDLRLARRALVVRRRQMRIEPRVEQRHDLRGDGASACAASPTCSPANRARGSDAESARWCGSARRRASRARPTAPARYSRRSRRACPSRRGNRLRAALGAARSIGSPDALSSFMS